MALPAGRQVVEADAIPGREPHDLGADLFDDSGDLVARGERQPLHAARAVAVMGVGVTDARGPGAHQDLVGSDHRDVDLLELEGTKRPEGEARCPADLLEEVFELREAMAEGDGGAAREKAESLLAEAESSLEPLSEEYDEAADGETARQVLAKLRAALDRRRFIAGLVAETC